jgi:hypothetical protein
MIFSTA